MAKGILWTGKLRGIGIGDGTSNAPETPLVLPGTHALQDTRTDQVANDPAQVDIGGHDTSKSHGANFGSV